MCRSGKENTRDSYALRLPLQATLFTAHSGFLRKFAGE